MQDQEQLDSTESSTEVKAEVVPTNEEEAEEFAKALVQRAASLKVVKIERGVFLRSEIKRRFPEIDADVAVETTPAKAGIAPEDLDRMAIDAIDLETKKCAGLSFLPGIPGGLAMVGTVPADLAQYFAHIMRIEQKLAYIYGWQTFLNDNDEVDDETVMKLVVLMGVMMQVGGVANAVTTFAANTARAGIEKAIQKQALTKTFWYTPMKKVLRYLGVNLTKQTFAKTASKVVPVIGGAISGGMTYMAYKPAAERLRRYLRSLPTSGIDEALHPDIIAIEADKAAAKRDKALDEAKAATLNAAQSIGELAAGTAQVAGSAAVEGLQVAGTAAAEGLQVAGATAAEGLQAVGASAKSALGAAGGFLNSLASRAKANRAASVSESHADDTFESNLERVKKLKELLDCGVLTQEEFDSKKRELLGL